jgi:hypothetical protein
VHFHIYNFERYLLGVHARARAHTHTHTHTHAGHCISRGKFFAEYVATREVQYVHLEVGACRYKRYHQIVYLQESLVGGKKPDAFGVMVLLFYPNASDLNIPRLTQHSDSNTHSINKLHWYLKN